VSFWDSLWDRLVTFGETFIEWAILILIALVVLVIGRWIIRLISKLLAGFLDASILDGMWKRSGVSKALADGDQTPGSIVYTIIYAYLMVVLLLIVAGIVNLPAMQALLIRLLAWIPLLLLAAVIVVVFAAAGSWAAGLVKPFADEQNVGWLTWVVHVGVIVFGLLFAMEIVNVSFAGEIVTIIIGSATIALAIAFGVGGIDAGKQWWAKYGTPKGSTPESHSTDYQQ
jgi:hypothetical protein